MDYLLKPFSDERFEESLDRAKSALSGERAAELRRRLSELLRDTAAPRGLRGERAGVAAGDSPDTAGRLERLAVRKGDRVLVVEASTVDWIEADGDYVTLHVGKTKYLIRGTMASLERRLDPARFLRIHRSLIVQIDRVRHLLPSERGDYDAALVDGTRLRIGPRYRARLLQQVGLR